MPQFCPKCGYGVGDDGLCWCKVAQPTLFALAHPDRLGPVLIATLTPLQVETLRCRSDRPPLSAVPCPAPLFAAGSPFGFAPTQAVPPVDAARPPHIARALAGLRQYADALEADPCTTTTPAARPASRPAG